MSICSSGVWLVNAAALARDARHKPEASALTGTVVGVLGLGLGGVEGRATARRGRIENIVVSCIWIRTGDRRSYCFLLS